MKSEIIPYSYFNPLHHERIEHDGSIFLDPGDDCYYYEHDNRPYILIDRGDWGGEQERIFVIDIGARRHFTLTWWRSRVRPERSNISCSCGGFHIDPKTDKITQPCPHYEVWKMYYLENIWEPVE